MLFMRQIAEKNDDSVFMSLNFDRSWIHSDWLNEQTILLTPPHLMKLCTPCTFKGVGLSSSVLAWGGAKFSVRKLQRDA